MPRGAKAASDDTYVALLRGINVGGKNLLPMPELTKMFTAAGCSDVRSYIQSGNVIFKAAAKLVEPLPAIITKRISSRFGYDVPLILRSGAELAAIGRRNPFLAPSVPQERLLVMFLADEPNARSVAALDANRSPPDQFAVRGREIYLYLPNGFAKTKLSNVYFDSKLATTSTGRNWRTVLKLLELTTQ
jgi:uncharacterized protein (DUF1697 family)